MTRISGGTNPTITGSDVHAAVCCDPEPDDQLGNCRRRGSRGGRPVNFDADRYRGRNVVERSFNRIKNSRGLALATTSTS